MFEHACWALLLTLPALEPAGAEEPGRPRNINLRPVWRGAKPDGAKQTLVLAVGVNDYEKAVDLKYCRADAHAVGRAFVEVGLVPEENVIVLTDEKGPLDNKGVVDALDRVLARATAGHRLVFYFSGHGFPSGGKLYLTNSKFDTDNPAGTGLAVDTLRDKLARCKAEFKLVLLDACYSGGFNKEGAHLGGVALAAALEQLKNAVTITSSTDMQPSHESDEFKHGVFTHWLVQGLRGRANTRIDKQIDVNELFTFLQERAVGNTPPPRGWGKQQPTWTFERQAGLPKVIDLFRPDSPRLLVPVAKFGLPPQPFVLEQVYQTISQFPTTNPYNNIGLSKWILKHAPPDSELAGRVRKHLEKIDQAILAGDLQLDESQDE